METTVKRHPIRGFLWGIILGLGLALIVVGQGMAALGTWPPFLVFIAGIVISVLWGMFGPAKGPKGPPPSGASVVEDEAPDPEPDLGPDPDPEPEPAPVAASYDAGGAAEAPAEAAEGVADVAADAGADAGADFQADPGEGDSET